MPYLSEKFLKSRLGLDHAPGVKIEDDRSCTGCGYNLKGLTFGRACPECGQTIQRDLKIGLKDDLIGQGDPELRKRMQIGLGLASGCLLFALVARLLSLISAAFIVGEASSLYHMSILFNSVLWLVGVWLITPKAIDLQWPRLKALRLSIRFTQLLWPLALGAYAIAQMAANSISTTLESQLLSFQFTGRVIAGGGVLGLVWLMLVIAQGADLEKASRRLSSVLWGLPIFTIMAALFPDTFMWILLWILGLLLLGWAWMLAWFALALLEMSRHAGWSIHYMHEQIERDSRVMQKRADLQREAEKNVRPTSTRQATDIPLDS
ncbi:MAG: hypothetical protein O7G85_03350 [Planctomycetota bacterium]|nr:hypothetical protein [Planctomycetota bacterium]